MKIILSGGTGVLGSEIIYEVLSYFIENSIDGKLFLVVRSNNKLSATERIDKLLTYSFAPKTIIDIGLKRLKSYIEVLELTGSENIGLLSSKLEDAYFIHAAGFVNLSTDADQYDSIYSQNKQLTESLLTLLGPVIKKFIYISTAYCSGIRSGLIANDFQNLTFEPQFRNAYERAKFESEKFVINYCISNQLKYQILRPSVIGGRLMAKDNNFYVLKYMGFYLLGKFFHFYSKSKNRNENVRIPINFGTGLNIIPVDYVAKVVLKTLFRDDILQLNIAHQKSYDIAEGIKIIMDTSGYPNFSLVAQNEFVAYQNFTEKLYFEKIGKHLSPYLNAPDNEYDVQVLNAILPIPALDPPTFKSMIAYGVENNFYEESI
jgi:nucleoside-diphosphate-sugar epimerase